MVVIYIARSVKGRVVLIYRRPWNTHPRSTRIKKFPSIKISGRKQSPVLDRVDISSYFVLILTECSSEGPIGCRLHRRPTVPDKYFQQQLLATSYRRNLAGYVGRDDGDKGPTLRDSPRCPLRDVISSRHRLGFTLVTTMGFEPTSEYEYMTI